MQYERRTKNTNLGGFPHGFGVLAILLNKGQDTGSNNTVRLAEIMIDLFFSRKTNKKYQVSSAEK